MTAQTATTAPEPERARTCFVIGPIGDRHAAIGTAALKSYEESLETFEKVILPACAKHRIEPVRADRIAHAGEITEQICRHVLEDDIVIADVSGGNANVMYELGLRHVTGKPTIHIGEHGQLPFDISPIRTIQFVRSRSGLVDARNELERVLEESLDKGFDLLTPARILLGVKTADSSPLLGQPEGESPDEDALGLVDRFVLIEEHMDTMKEDMEIMSDSVNAIAAETRAAGPDLQRAARPGSPMSAYVPVMARYAESIKEPSANLRKSAERFAERMSDIDDAMRATLNFMQIMPPDTRADGYDEFLGWVVGTSKSTRESMETLSLFGTMVRSMIGMSRHLRGPGRDVSVALKEIGGAMSRMEDWERRARDLM